MLLCLKALALLRMLLVQSTCDLARVFFANRYIPSFQWHFSSSKTQNETDQPRPLLSPSGHHRQANPITLNRHATHPTAGSWPHAYFPSPSAYFCRR
jgi:hypothetical protein